MIKISVTFYLKAHLINCFTFAQIFQQFSTFSIKPDYYGTISDNNCFNFIVLSTCFLLGNCFEFKTEKAI